MPNRTVHFTFLRHGHATHNRDAEMYGESAYFDVNNADSQLTPKGIQQANTLHQNFEKLSVFDYIYCSPLRRCRETLLLVIPEANTYPVILDDRIMEPQGMAICNKRIEKHELIKTVSTEWNLDNVNNVNPYYIYNEGYDVSQEGGPKKLFQEKIENFLNDVRSTVSELPADKKDVNILVVSHHDWILTCSRLLENREIRLENCTIEKCSMIVS